MDGVEKRYDGSSATPFSKVRISWTYDAEDRLIEETRDADSVPGDGNDDYTTRDTIVGGDYSDVFTYDLAGNRITKVHGWDANGDGDFADGGEATDESITYSYDGDDRLETEDSSINANDKGYGYDANGNQISLVMAIRALA